MQQTVEQPPSEALEAGQPQKQSAWGGRSFLFWGIVGVVLFILVVFGVYQFNNWRLEDSAGAPNDTLPQVEQDPETLPSNSNGNQREYVPPEELPLM